MDTHDPPPTRTEPATPTLTAGSRDRLRLVLTRRWRRRVTRSLAVCLGAAGLNRLRTGDHCAAFERAAAVLDRSPALTVAAIERAAAVVVDPDGADLVRRIAAASARRGTPSARRAATALRTAAVWRCVVGGVAARCPCVMGSWTGADETTPESL